MSTASPPHFQLTRTAALPRSVGGSRSRSRRSALSNPLSSLESSTVEADKKIANADVNMHGVDNLDGVEEAWKSKQFDREEKWVGNELDRKKKTYKDAIKQVHKHPHTALRAQRAVAGAALKKIQFLSKKRSRKVEKPKTDDGHSSKSTSLGTAPSMLTRSHSLLGRFNPGESHEHYQHTKQQNTIETLTWLKLKLLVNHVQDEMADKIEEAWEVFVPSLTLTSTQPLTPTRTP